MYMRMRLPPPAVFVVLFCLALPSLAKSNPPEIELAQLSTRHAPAASGEEGKVARVNDWTVGIAGGLLEGTFIRFAAELAKALDDGDNLRVLPIVTYGAAENVSDLLYLFGVDIAITYSDVLDQYRKSGEVQNIEQRINYISQLYIGELHVFARPEIRTLADLDGKKVGFNTKGAGPTITGPIVFERLGIHVEPVFINNAIAIEKMKTGELAAILHTVGKPNDLFVKLQPIPGFHFIPVEYNEKLADYYLPSTLSHDDYPNLIPVGKPIDTIGIPALLAVYNWPKESDRYRRVERFINYLFDRVDRLKQPSFHPKWKDINLAATVPGWTRYPVAEQKVRAMISERLAPAPTQSEVGGRTLGGSAEQRLFEEFLDWQRDHNGGAIR
jgi:TRAP-type uncharacterized transport system substrate-binding protein